MPAKNLRASHPYPLAILLSVVTCFLPLSVNAGHAKQNSPQSRADRVVNWERVSIKTIGNVGAAQGISAHGKKFYIYGDREENGKHLGVIVELDQNLEPTGRTISLSESLTESPAKSHKKPLAKEASKKQEVTIHHPTGLTWNKRWGAVMGDTVYGTGKIYRLDWERMLKQGDITGCVLSCIEDDLAVNGSRPVFVEYERKSYLASADYGDKNPELRLYDPELLFNPGTKALKKGRTSNPGVLKGRTSCGPFNQNLHYDKRTDSLTFIQNVDPGIGWQLDTVNLSSLLKHGIKEARLKKLTLSPKTELEGFCPLEDRRAIFITSCSDKNVVIIHDLKLPGNKRQKPLD